MASQSMRIPVFSDRAASRSCRKGGFGAAAPAIAFDHVSLAFDDLVVLRDVSFRVPEGDMTILLGPSGAGKSVILKLTLGLLRPDSGSIAVHGERIEQLRERELIAVRDRIGMLFQETALFDSLTVGENVGFKLQDQRMMDARGVRDRVQDVLHFVGLDAYADRLPAQLSGGQRRRVAIARAMAAAPSLLLLDDPTSGLDPITAKTVLAEIVKLRDLHHVSGLVVTHQLQDAFYMATHEAIVENGSVTIRRRDGRAHFLVLRDGEMRFDGTARALMKSDDPWIAMCLTGWIPELTLDTPSPAARGLVLQSSSASSSPPSSSVSGLSAMASPFACSVIAAHSSAAATAETARHS